VKIVLDSIPGPSRNFDDYEIVYFLDNYSSDSDLFLPTETDYGVSETDI
jgi:hypothetical protein